MISKKYIALSCILVFCFIIFLYLFFRSHSQRPNIILITIDTLRADHLISYGYERETSPAIYSLAKDGIIFDDAVVTLPTTTPSLVSVLSGLYPKTHKVFSVGFELDPSIQLLPEILKKQGYQTGGVCGQYNCNRMFGFNQGFDYYDDDFVYITDRSISMEGGKFHPASEKRARYIVKKSIEWIKKVQDTKNPFFMWLHLNDPHAAYDPPGKYGRIFSGSTRHTSNSFFGADIPSNLIHFQANVPGVIKYDYYLNKYDGEIRYMDSYLKTLFDFLKKNNIYDNALIIFTGDHGEYMGENSLKAKYFTHGTSLFESEIKVPLIVKLPKNTFSNRRVSFHVSTVDIFPTIIDIIGVEDIYHEGKNLLELINNPKVGNINNANFIQVYFGHMIGIRKDNYKLIVRTDYDILTLIELLKRGKKIDSLKSLYDFKADPLERKNIAEDNKAIVKSLSSELFNWIVDSNNDIEKNFISKEKTDEETLKHLKSLGYLN